MNDLETLRRAQQLLGEYGFTEEQQAVAKAVRIISATAKRLGMAAERPRTVVPFETPGERLKRLREAAGITRGQLAEQSEVALSTVRAHENGDLMSADAAQVYARILGTTVAMILAGRE